MAVNAREAGNCLRAESIPGPLELVACTLCATPPRLSIFEKRMTKYVQNNKNNDSPLLFVLNSKILT